MDKEWHLMKSIFGFIKRDDFQLVCKEVPAGQWLPDANIMGAVFNEFAYGTQNNFLENFLLAFKNNIRWLQNCGSSKYILFC